MASTTACGGPAGDAARDELAGDDARGPAVLHHHVEHLDPGVHLHRARCDLPGESTVGAEKQLLTGLAPGVEGAGDLSAAEGPVGEEAAVLPGEGDALGGAVVDDGVADLGESVDVRFARPEVAPLDGVVEEATHAVAVVLVVLRCIDAALGGDAVGATRTVLEAEAIDLIAELAQGGGGGGACEARPHDDHPGTSACWPG